MLEFGRRLQEARLYLGYTRKDFAKMVGLAASTIGRYESGEIDATLGVVCKIATKLNMSEAWFLGLSSGMYDDYSSPYKKLPIISQIRTTPALHFENFDGFEIVNANSEADFCVKIKDDTMIKASIKPRSTLLFKRQDTAENGDIVAIIENDKIIVRRYNKYGNQVVLREEGNKIIDTEVKEANIIGKAISNITEVE